jgi:hypothetical protein
LSNASQTSPTCSLQQTPDWAVITTRPNSEALVERWITRFGLAEVYIPQFYSALTRRVRALWPSYALLRNVSDWTRIFSLPGVRKLVTQEGHMLVPDHEVARIRAREDAAGFVVLPDPYQRGAKVEIRKFSRGYLRGFQNPDEPLIDAVCDGMCDGDRVFVLLKFLGRVVRTKVRRDLLLLKDDEATALAWR